MQNPNAAFFLRDPSFLDDLSEDQADRYIDYNPEAVQHLRVCSITLWLHILGLVAMY